MKKSKFSKIKKANVSNRSSRRTYSENAGRDEGDVPAEGE